MTKLTKGMRVTHASKPEWGVGQLLEDANSEHIRVFFAGKGEVVLGTAFADKLQPVTGQNAQSDLLDNLHLPTSSKSWPLVTIPQARTRMLELFPGGLHGPRMQDNERAYKDRLVTLAHDLYDKEVLQAALNEERYLEIVESAVRLVKHPENNFPSSFEKIRFVDAMRNCTRQEAFARAFCNWVMPTEPSQIAFEAITSELASSNTAKWPILTAWRFVLHPQTDVLIKPENIQKAAAVARFEVNYKPELNWLTYYSVMQFYNYIRTQIADLEPRDMIDVQNFIWCTDPDQYPS